MQVQRQLGADIAMQLDVCPPAAESQPVVEAACRLTTAWAQRCLRAQQQARERGEALHQAVFGIVQGGTDPKLRIAHAEEIAALPFEGIALGGFSVGEPIEKMHEVLAEVAPQLDPARPRYLMGVGTPTDLIHAVSHGVDMFDCVLPTRNARNGQVFTRHGRLVIKHARFKQDGSVLEPGCGCMTCSGGYSRAYLRHLFMQRELLVFRLLSAHNLFVYGELMAEMRQAIIDGSFATFRASRLQQMRRA